ncbi:hypothetical protein D9613_005289 [Agrocybe pediades]|uniref:MutL C-terminal dimerisation domain-containing protein n=1 Tax=Agrocybe pediades TaxID=84607 RepID=A0A8H4VRQ9_9AGAR|nr:hypothetical protein D9613_005289 [Agrocybe pediades]
MDEALPAIGRLPLPTQTRLRSTQILTSLVQIVSELLQNALDAQATHVEIGVDCQEWSCWVTDNGRGIPKEELELLAQVGGNGRYNTSKTYESSATSLSSTFGFRGEALASAADISCLEICSRALNSRNTWSIIMKGDKLLYSGAAVRWKRESPGTTVCVRDAFYNLPVRRLAHTPASRTWDLIRRELETYSLMFPNVSFTLKDTSGKGERSQNANQTIRIPKTKSTLGAFRHLFGSALVEHIEDIHEIEESLTMEGFISLSGAPSKLYQFLYINRHPVAVSDLNRTIEAQFASSSFGKNALDEGGKSDMPHSTIRRSPRKSEKKPVYVLNIIVPPTDVDNYLDPNKSVVQFRDKSSVMGLLSRTCRTFLQKHGFLTRDGVHLSRSPSPSPSPRKRMKLDIGNPEYDATSEISCLSLRDTNPTVGARGAGEIYASTEGISEEIVWEDLSTGERFVVDSRTGNSSGQAMVQPRMNAEDMVRRDGRRTLRQRETHTMATDSGVTKNPIPMWLERALMSNQAYAMTQNAIPSAKVLLPPPHNPAAQNIRFKDKKGCQKELNHGPNDPFHFEVENLEAMFTHSAHRLSKDDIRHAEIISQVDRKFIVCRVRKRSNDSVSPQETGGGECSHSSVLILIDQHAADERIRVERILKELLLGFLNSKDGTGGVRRRELNPPRPILLTQHEALIIKRSQDDREMLRKWGVEFAELSKVMVESDSVPEPGRASGYTQLLVSSIPEIVGDKVCV